MRHGKKVHKLGRTASHRKALMANMASQLLMHKRINTTLAKAKALRVFIEPLMTKAKSDTTHNRRTVFSYVRDKHALKELFGDIAIKIADRPGGYTRIIRTGHRLGDAAEMAMIELVDYNDVYTNDSKSGSDKKTRRSRRGGKKSTGAADAPKADKAADADVAAAPEKAAEAIADVDKNVAKEAAKNVEEAVAETTQAVEETATEAAEAAEDAVAEVTSGDAESKTDDAEGENPKEDTTA